MKAIIYGKPGCPNCDKAKMLCTTKGIAYDYKQVGIDIQVEQLQEMAGGPVRSVPQIFLMEDGLAEYVGGYTDLVSKIS